MNILKPDYKINVNHKDKTGDFTPYLISLEFTDKLTGQTDELTITLEDTQGHWQGDWYPVKGTEIEVYLGYQGNLLNCGTFTVESIDIKGPPDTVSIKALGTSNKKAIRTPTNKSHTDTTLADIAKTIAAKHALETVGEIPERKYKYNAQVNETDLAYLQRLAHENNTVFTIKGNKLIFHNYEQLAAQKTTYILTKDNTATWSYSDKVVATKTTAAHFDGNTEELITSEESTDSEFQGDTQKNRRPVENQAQQTAATKSATRNTNAKEATWTISTTGNIKLVAGCNIELSGWSKKLDQIMQITEARHKIERGAGYTTELTLQNK